jgi:hypothetical protein
MGPIDGAMTVPRLRVVVFPETTKAWTARSLEHDLAAVGRTAEAAVGALMRVASAHVAYDIRHGRPPLSAFCAAPRPYWNAYAGASIATKPMEVRTTDPQGTVSCLVTVTRDNPAIRRMPPYRIA